MKKHSDVLRETYPYKTELHSHTFPASACATASAEDSVMQHKANGYHTLVITNHLLFDTVKNQKGLNSILDAHISDFKRAEKLGEELGIKVLMGYELRFPKSDNDYLFYGADPEFLKGLDMESIASLEAFCVVRGKDTLLIQAHPFRNMMTLAPRELIDGIESFNMSPNMNSRVGIASAYAQDENLFSICGSDYHHTKSGTLTALRTKERIEDIHSLVKVLKSEDVAWQIGQAMLVF